MQSERDVDCSFVVAIYNREATLDRCLESLAYQRTTRTFEIILVDDQSTDGSLAIARAWQARFPQLIRVCLNNKKGVAHAKNLGVKESRGRFVAFVDSDDYVDFKYLQTMLAADAAMSADMVIAPIWSIRGGVKIAMQVAPKDCGYPTKRDFLSGIFYFLHGKLFRRRLFDEYGLLPPLAISEDTSWVFPAIARTKNIVYVRVAGYYYEFSDNSISISFHSRELVESAVKSSELIIGNTPSRFRPEAEAYVMHRLLKYYVPKFKGYESAFREFLFKHPELCVRWCAANAVSQPDAAMRLKDLLEAGTSPMPNNVFTWKNPYPCGTVFEDGANVENLEMEFPLHEGMALPESVKAAIASGRMDFAAGYLAVRRIFERGGVFMGENVEPLHPFSRFAESPAFFAHSTGEEFSERVFGGLPGSEAFRQILSTYDSPAFAAYAPLSERIRVVVTGMTNLPGGESFVEQASHGIVLCPVSMLVYSDGPALAGALSIVRDCPLESILAFERERTRKSLASKGAANASSPFATVRERTLAKERDYYRKQITAMETSVVWRLKESLKRPLSRLGVFSPLKRCGNALLRMVKV